MHIADPHQYWEMAKAEHAVMLREAQRTQMYRQIRRVKDNTHQEAGFGRGFLRARVQRWVQILSTFNVLAHARWIF